MSVRIMNAVFEFDMPDLKTDKGVMVPGHTAKFVLLALADCGDDEGEGIYLGIKRLTAKVSMSNTTVCNAINALRLAGYLDYLGRSRYNTKTYKINKGLLLGIPVAGISNTVGNSSGSNLEILGAGVKPLVKSLDIKESEQIIEMPLPKPPGTSGFPGDVKDYAVAFAILFGRDPIKSERGHWIKVFRDKYIKVGITVDELKRAYVICAKDNLNIKSPDSIFFKADELHRLGGIESTLLNVTQDGKKIMRTPTGEVITVFEG